MQEAEIRAIRFIKEVKQSLFTDDAIIVCLEILKLSTKKLLRPSIVCFCLVAKLCLTRLCLDGLLQARILEWVAISFSRGSYQPKDQTRISCVSCIGGRILHHCATVCHMDLSKQANPESKRE